MHTDRNSKSPLPWGGIIKKIDDTIDILYAGFDSAFAEAQTNVKPREFIKRAFFRKVWKELTFRTRFEKLSELDAYFQNIHHNLNAYHEEFVLQDVIKTICDQNNIVPGPNEKSVISTRKMEMLDKIITLYHSLYRNRFILTQLSEQLSLDRSKLYTQVQDDKEKLFNQLTADRIALQEELEKQRSVMTSAEGLQNVEIMIAQEQERLGRQFEEDRQRIDARLRDDQYFITAKKCEDMVDFLLGQSEVNKELVGKIDIDLYRTRSINALKTLSQRLIDALKTKGYGEIAAKITPASDKQNHAILCEIYSRIDDLPKMSELMNIVNGKTYDNKDMRAHKLFEHIRTVQILRYVIQQIREDILTASHNNVEQLTAQYDVLKEINKVDYNHVLGVFFQHLDDLTKSQKTQSSTVSDFPALLTASQAALSVCNQQSQMEKYTGIVNNGWSVAGSSLRDHVLDILKTTQSELAPYLESKEKFTDDARSEVEKLTSMYTRVMDFIKEWHEVNDETLTVLNQCDNLLAIVEATLISASQTMGQFLLGFGKRHWLEMGIVATVFLVPAIAVPLGVASVTALAVTVPTAATGGSAIGAAVGLFRDKNTPPAAPAVELPEAVKQGNRITVEAINKRLFDAPAPIVEAEMVVHDVEASRKPEAVAEEAVFVPRVVEARTEQVSPDELPYAPSFMERFSNVPGVSTLVALPSQALNLPSQVVHVASSIAALPGFFATRPEQGSATNKEAPVINKPK